MDETALRHHLDGHISGNKIEGANMAKVRFINANLTSVEFEKTNLRNSYFHGSTLNNINMSECSLTESIFTGVNRKLKQGKLTVKDCNLSRSNITNSDCSYVSLVNCNMTGMLINGIPVKALTDAYKAKRHFKFILVIIVTVFILAAGILLYLLWGKN